MMKKAFTVLLCVLLCAGIFAGCGSTAPETGASSETASVFPMTVTDQAGNEVTVEKLPERIISGYYISSSACIALGLKDRLVGIEEKSEKRPIYGLAAPELPTRAVNVGSAKEFDLEACISAEPELMILPKKAADYAATLTEMGIPAIIVNPESHDQLVEMIRLIAKLTDTADQAEKLIAYYDRTLSFVQEKVSVLPAEELPVVYMCGASGYLRTAPKEMYQASLIRSAGGVNAGDVLDGDSWTDVSYEQLLAMDPDIIIIPTNNLANGEPDYSAQDILSDETLSDIKAVKDHAVYNMPTGFESWDSPTPSGVLGVLWMLSTLHPEAYSAEDFSAQAAEFYEEFYGFTIDRTFLAG